MEDNFEKPLYNDYEKQKAYKYLSKQIISRERIYTLADRPYAVIGDVLLYAVILVMVIYAPGFFSSILRGVLTPLLLIIPMVCCVLYRKLFVYRFGRFLVKWEHSEEHPGENASERCDASGGFIMNDENRKAALKSRRSYMIFYLVLLAAVFLFCFLGYGLAYMRVYSWHRAEIEEAVQIAEKYDSLTAATWSLEIDVDGETADRRRVSKLDEAKLKQILGSLQWDYVCSMGYGDKPYETAPERNRFVFYLLGGFGYRSYLVRYDEAAGIEQVQNDYPKEMVTQLDEHWWYVR